MFGIPSPPDFPDPFAVRFHPLIPPLFIQLTFVSGAVVFLIPAGKDHFPIPTIVDAVVFAILLGVSYAVSPRLGVDGIAVRGSPTSVGLPLFFSRPHLLVPNCRLLLSLSDQLRADL